MKFLDPDKPIATCVSETCENCEVSKTLHCHFSQKDLLHFLLIAAPSFLIGGAGVFNINPYWLIPWLIIVVGYFGFVEIRVMCSHCPHYAEAGITLQCWANYGSPRIWRFRPGPMSFKEKAVFFTGFAIVWGYPAVFLISGLQIFLIIIYLITTAGLFSTLKLYLCSQCMNFTCPLNTVKSEVRMEFFKRNPEISKAWGIGVNTPTKKATSR